MMRLGFVVKPLGRPDLRSHDGRRWQHHPHLSVSLIHLRDIIRYLMETDISMYRVSSELAPYATHPDLPDFHTQLDQCHSELGEIGRLATQAGVRLSFHAATHIVLNSPNADQAARSHADLVHLATILDLMTLNQEAVVVTHIGGVYGDREASRRRFVQEFLKLPEATRKRLVLENDDTRYSVEDTIWVNQQTGIRLIFDNLHHRLNNPCNWQTRDALTVCLSSWPETARPKIHFSSPRTEWLVTQRPGDEQPEIRQARWSYHADFVNPFEFIDFIDLTKGLREFDVMLEVRAKDLALLQLEHDLSRYAPAVFDRLALRSRHDTLNLSPTRAQSTDFRGSAQK